MKTNNCYYFCEGEMERKLVKIFVSKKLIIPGKQIPKNIVNDHITKFVTTSMKSNCTLIFIYDTDVENISLFKKNLDFLKRQTHPSKIIYIPQCKNFEDELLRSTNLRSVLDLFKSSSIKDYKHKFLKSNDEYLWRKLAESNFEFNLFWSSIPKNSPFSVFSNNKDLLLLDNKHS